MDHRGVIGALALVVALIATTGDAGAFDEAKYPNLKGQWRRIPVPGVVGQPGYDQTKIQGWKQEPPLTPEAAATLNASLADQAAGGQGGDPTYTCKSPGMPRIMTAYDPMEVVVTPDTVHIFIEHIHDSRRVYTDGRDWPAFIEPSFAGYSIGRWIDTKATGHYDLLEVETRGFRGPRAFDATGIPLDANNASVIKERIYVDAADPEILYDDITTIDSSLTRPWSVTKKYGREKTRQPVWEEANCAEGNGHVEIGGRGYFLSADGRLMPTKKDQPPPDLRYFKQAQAPAKR
jgi:hypothetical protein